MWIYIWLGVIVFCLILEGLTTTLTCFWFALGGVAALIAASFLPDGIILQCSAFVVVSALSLLLLRPIARRSMAARRTATNADRVLGMVGVVVEDIDNLTAAGVVQVGGKTWTARSETGKPIAKGAQVDVLRIDGVKLIVQPKS